MKLFIQIVICFLCNFAAHGSGKLLSELGYYERANSLGGKLGVSIHEKIFWRLFYAQYTGLGYSPQIPNERMVWVNTNHDLVLYFDKFSVGAGAGVQYGDESFAGGFKSFDWNYHIKVGYELW